MDYQLAKQLWDAKFPYSNDFSPRYDVPAVCGDGNPACIIPPTLEELIEACGNDFFGLQNWRSTINPWRACSPYFKKQSYKGQTPDEAVARLWLALNKASHGIGPTMSGTSN